MILSLFGIPSLLAHALLFCLLFVTLFLRSQFAKQDSVMLAHANVVASFCWILFNHLSITHFCFVVAFSLLSYLTVQSSCLLDFHKQRQALALQMQSAFKAETVERSKEVQSCFSAFVLCSFEQLTGGECAPEIIFFSFSFSFCSFFLLVDRFRS
jgi:hypothetical protein